MKRFITLLLTITLAFGCFAQTSFLDKLQNIAEQEITNALSAEDYKPVEPTTPSIKEATVPEEYYVYINSFARHYLYDKYDSIIGNTTDEDYEDYVDYFNTLSDEEIVRRINENWNGIDFTSYPLSDRDEHTLVIIIALIESLWY